LYTNNSNLGLRAWNNNIGEQFNNIMFEINVPKLIDYSKTIDNFLIRNEYVEADFNNNSELINSSNWDIVMGDYKDGKVTSEQIPFYKSHWYFAILKRKLNNNEQLNINFGDSINDSELTVSFFLSDNDYRPYKDYLHGRIPGSETMKCNMMHFLIYNNELAVNRRKNSKDEYIYSARTEISCSNIHIARYDELIMFSVNNEAIQRYYCTDGYNTVALGISGSEDINVELINKISIAQKKSVIYLNPIDMQGKGYGESMNLGILCKGNPLVQFEQDGIWVNAREVLRQSNAKLQLRIVLSGADRVYKCFVYK